MSVRRARINRGPLPALAVVLFAAGCTGGATPTAAVRQTAGPATPAATSVSLTRTTAPSPTIEPATWLPADDGARIITVSAPPQLVPLVQSGSIFVSSNPIAVTRVRDLLIDSPAVGPVRVRLLLPNRFDEEPATLWPVLYLLGGSSGTYDGWTLYMDAEALTASTDLLVVMADQGANDPGGSSFSDWWNGGKGGRPMWETFHLTELRQLLERNWHAGDKRAIAGASKGGYGAMEYASRHPGMFLFAGSFSGGGLHPTGEPSTEPVAKWGDQVQQAEIWKAHDPSLNADALRGTALFVAYGNGEPGALDNYAISPWDPTGEAERYCAADSAAFVNRLHALKIPVTVSAYGKGTHGAAYFRRDFEQSLPLIVKALGL